MSARVRGGSNCGQKATVLIGRDCRVQPGAGLTLGLDVGLNQGLSLDQGPTPNIDVDVHCLYGSIQASPMGCG